MTAAATQPCSGIFSQPIFTTVSLKFLILVYLLGVKETFTLKPLTVKIHIQLHGATMPHGTGQGEEITAVSSREGSHSQFSTNTKIKTSYVCLSSFISQKSQRRRKFPMPPLYSQ